jgi:uncharacterized membrane protein YfcA
VEFLILFVAVLLGAVIQGAIGFGLALVVVPVLTLVRPEVLPAMVLLLMVPMAMIMAARERGEIDVTGLAYLLSGRLAGTLGGMALLLLVLDDYLSVLFGSLVLVAVLASSFSPKVALHNRTRVVGGVASGVMGTVAGIGGPPLALIYQSHSGPQIRATLAVAFSVGMVLSLAALFLAGRVGADHLLLALKLLPALLLGLGAARFVAELLAGRWLRRAILLFAAVSGLAAVLLGVAG